MTDDELRRIVIDTLNDVPGAERSCYVYSSGPDKVTELKYPPLLIARAIARAAEQAERERVWLEAERLCLERMHASCVMAERATTQESRTRWNAAATDSKCCADRMRAMYIDAARARGAKERGNGD